MKLKTACSTISQEILLHKVRLLETKMGTSPCSLATSRCDLSFEARMVWVERLIRQLCVRGRFKGGQSPS